MGGSGSGTVDDRDRDVDLARRASAGDSDAFGQLFQGWFDRAFDVAWHVVHNRDTAAEVAQDAFATAWQQIAQLRQPESFGGWLLRITRNKALNRLRREQRSRPVGPVGDEATPLEAPTAADASDPLLEQERDRLVWVAAAALGDDDASLLNLHLRHGLDPTELADELGVQPNAAHQRLFRLRQRLGDAIGAWVLWRHGSPSCPSLAGALSQLDQTGFDRTTARAIWRHTRTCEDCESTRQLRLEPGTLFAAIPLVPAGPLLRTRAASALESQGVPTGSPPTPADHPPDDSPQPDDGQDLDSPDGEGPSDHPPPDDDTRPGQRRSMRRAALAGTAAVALLLVALLFALATRTDDDPTPTAADSADDDPESIALPSRTSESTTTTTTEPTTATTTTTQPSTTDPIDPSPTTSPPATTPTTADTTPSTEPTAPPTIGGFRASRGSTQCPTGQISTLFAWSTTAADTVTLGPTGGAGTPVEPTGSAAFCAAPQSQWTLTATNPGGSVTATATTPAAIP